MQNLNPLFTRFHHDVVVTMMEARDRVSDLADFQIKLTLDRFAKKLGSKRQINYTDGMGTRFITIERVDRKGRVHVIHSSEYYTNGDGSYGYYFSGDRRMKALFRDLHDLMAVLEELSTYASMDFNEYAVQGKRK